MARAPRTIRAAQCTICKHPDRVRIELLRVGGASLAALAFKFGVSKDAVHRHFQNHVSADRRAELMAGPALVHDLANAAADESKSLLEQLQIVRSVLFNQFLNAAEARDRAGVANVAGRLLESLRELGRLTGELREVAGINIVNNTLNLVASPQFAALQEGLMQIGRAHPAARLDIIALMRRLVDEQPAPPRINGHKHVPTIDGEAANVG